MMNPSESRRARLLRSTAALTMLIGAATPAFAQQEAQDPTPADAVAAQGEDSAIVVTGFRASLQNSIAARRNADIILDAVSAEDIAGLPDVSIAEALARLPGVTSQRTGGQASAINVRGLSQDLVSATLNGREQVSTSGLRTIEFDQYPSELLSQAAVYKSPMASLIEGGIAGKVELQTARPLDQRDPFTVSVNLRGSWNDRAGQSPDADEFGYRASISFQAKLLDDTLGIALGYARLVQPNVATRFVGFDYTRTGTNGGGNAVDLDNDGVRDGIPFGFELIQFGGRETRDGVLGVIQYEPTESTRLLIDGYYSRFRSDVRRRGVRAFGTQNGNTALGTLQNPIVENSAIIGGRYVSGNGVDVELVNQDESDRDELYTIGANFQQDFGDRVTLSLDASYSRANSYFVDTGVNINPYRRNPDGTFTRLGAIPGALIVDYRLNGLSLPDVAINHDFTDPELNRFQGFFIVPREDDDELIAFAANLQVDLNGFFRSLQVGARYSTRNAERIRTSFNSFGIANNVAIPSDLFQIAGFRGPFANAGFPDFLVADIDGLLDEFVGPDRVADQSFGFTRDQSFIVEEDVWAGYAQLNFNSVVGGLNFRGNFGLRVVHTDQSSTTSLVDPSVPGGQTRYTLTTGDSYLDFLPSANLILELGEADRLRLSISRQISRPRFFDLGGGIGINLINIGGGVFQPSGSGGNPRLRPFRANMFDFAYEHYFGNSGILVLSAFYKDLKSFIVGGTVDEFNFREAGFTFPPLPTNAPPGATILDSGPLFAPINGDGGYVYGFEAQFTKTFTELPAPFDGLGVTMNYAYSQSSLDITNNLSGNTLTIPLPGLSKHVFNPTIFYDRNGFAARVGIRYRSGFVAPQFGLNEQITDNAPETVVDAQLSYTFQENSALRGLTLYLQGNNLTDAPTRSYFGQEAQTGTLQYFGRQFYAGATYRF
ncbi:TonB-dependent receptor [Sphingosinicella sp. LHD-64]|uniref:TonB-dependent receptor n=1 Tax=Sphingosinicella sp. LHD-64 TaxID=3072139 RepID=UPI00281049CC|nr:TonB-dependent receptor [Sphingosinicella sp. LHD-64]MDQ8756790.1 TonB-dependent receptor [Sphingosinicella sp. LHD-64]